MELKPLGLIDRAALARLQSKKRLGAFSHYDVWLDQHAYAFSVAKMMDEDLLRDTQEALAAALANGTSFREFKARLKPILMAKGWWGEAVMIDPLDDEPKLVQLGSTRRLKTIFQTNIATAHAASRWQRIWAARRSMPFLRYNASHAKHKREAHQRYVGLILPVEHALWQVIFPPNGYGCQCSVSPLTRKQAERAGGVSPEPDIDWVDVENPRTGEKVRVPRDITPSFAHNHTRRVENVLDLAAQRHGAAFARELEKQTQRYIDSRIQQHPTASLFKQDVFFENNTKEHFVIGDTVVSQSELAQLSGAIDGSLLSVLQSGADYLNIFIENSDIYQSMVRTLMIENNQLILKNETQILKDNARGKGIAVFALREQIRAAKRLNISKIKTFAVGDASHEYYNGYYTWARFGFNADIPPQLRKKLPKHLTSATDIADLMSTKEGRAWWKNNGSDINLTFDLSDNSKSIKIFQQYLLEKFGSVL